MNVEKKKVLVSINTSWNIFNFRKNLLQHLMDSGFHVIAAAPNDAYSQKLIDMGIEFREIQISQKGTNPFEDLSLLFAYRRIFKEVQPDICLFYTIKPNIYGSLAAYSEKIPYINNISGLGTVFLRKKLSSTIAKLLYRIALKKSSLVFFQNKHDKELFQSLGLLMHDRLKVIPGSGVDLRYFKSSKSRPNSGNFTFLMVSRLIFDKGIREFIEACRIVKQVQPDIQFSIVGKAENEAKLGYSDTEMKKICETDGINWHKQQDDVRPFFENADVVVLPSYREGMSRALIEALSMEKPILTSSVPGCMELVNDGQNGLLCEVKNANDLADKMIEFTKMPRERIQKMGENGRLFIKDGFSDERIFDYYLNAITDKLG